MGNLFSRLFAGVLAAVFISSSNAETIPTDYQQVAPTHYTLSGGQIGSTPQAACAVRGFTNVCQESGVNARVASCGITSCGGDSAYAVCPSGTSWNTSLFTCRTNIPTCPQTGGWTLQGSNCYRPDCQPGETRNPTTGACDKLCPVGWEKDAQGVCRKDCTNRLGRPLLDALYDTAADGTGQYDDCKVKCAKVVEYIGVTIGGEEHDFYTSSGCSYTGASADGTEKDMGSTGRQPTKKPTKKEDCLGQGDGYIQGSTGAVTCVPAKQAPPGQRPAKTTTQNNSESSTEDGTGNKTSTTTSQTRTKNADGTETTTTTTTTTNPDGTKTTTTTTDKVNTDGTMSRTEEKTETDTNGNETPAGKSEDKGQEPPDFCTKYPESPQCREQEKSEFGGSCEADFQCTGDAATCAIAQATNQLKCQGETRSDLNDLGDQVIAGTDGKGVDTIENQTINLSGGISTGSGSGGSCPPLPQIMGKTIDIGEACTILQGLGNAGVALSLLMAGFIVIGGIRGL